MAKQNDINRYKAALLARRQEILGRSLHREGIYIEESSDPIDTVQLASDREFAISILERESKNLAQIGAALQRIALGEFGICLECDEPISAKRLAVVPWAAYCLQCQELHDELESADAGEPQLVA
jgi:DnaK suppressor protein